MGPQRILGALGRCAWGLNESWGHSGGAHGAFTVRSMVTEPTEQRGGDQRYPRACHPTCAVALINLCSMLTALDGARIVYNGMRC